MEEQEHLAILKYQKDYSEVVGASGKDLILVSSDYLHNGRVKSMASGQLAYSEILSVINSSDFFATRSDAIETNIKQMKDGVISNLPVDSYEGLDIKDDYLNEGHYLVGIDENINIAIPHSAFDNMSKSFIKWLDRVSESKYVKTVSNNLTPAKTLMDQLQTFKKALEESVGADGNYDPAKFKKAVNNVDDAVFTMFNVMYGEKIDADWLQDAYISSKGALKSYKYKRLAQNQGYTRNSDTKRRYIKEIYKDSDNEYHKKLIEDYTDKDISNVLIIDDNVVSGTGDDVNNLITDNRRVVENNLKKMRDNDEISKGDYEQQLKALKEDSSINAEQANAMTAVRREELDYLMLMNGQGHLIGESSGQKPVGLSSYVDDNGIAHVFYNKTHYFYDSRLDEFFNENPDISQVAFTSGAKKAKKINTEDPKSITNMDTGNKEVENLFVPLKPTKINTEGKTNLTDFINSLRNIDSKNESVMPAKFNQMLSGVVYGKAKDAKVMKQFDNWTSEQTSLDMYEYARADMANKFAEVNVELYNSENTQGASAEAQSFISSDGNKDGTINTEVPNASVASLWIEGGGVPFSEISKNLYDALIKRKYIDDVGVFDGVTDAGGVPVLRANLDGDLMPSVYADNRQIKIGEVNIAPQFLKRKINFKSQFGAATKDKSGKIIRPSYKDKSSMSLVFTLGQRDILVDVKSGKITDPKNKNANIDNAEYSSIKKDLNSIKKELGKADDSIETWHDLYLHLKNSTFDSDDVRLGVLTMPAPRTGPQDAIVAKIKNLTDAKDGAIMELNSYDVTMRAQRDYDTDKMPFYMDIPASAMESAYVESSIIREPKITEDKMNIDLDMYDNKSFTDYNQKVNNFKKLRGPVVRMQRKITYATNLMKAMDGIELPDLGDGFKLVINDSREAKQRLVNSTQEALDIYAGLPNTLKDISKWTEETLYGSKKGYEDGFFAIKDSEGKLSKVENIGHRLIVEKILDDFGRLLNLEGNIWEAGQAKSPRYDDMYTSWHDFKHAYDSEYINYNFYNYMIKKGYKDVADKLFFESDPRRRSQDRKKGAINPILSKLSKAVDESSTPFLKSLKAIAETHQFRVREKVSNANNHYNKTVLKLVGRQRAEALEIFRRTGEQMSARDYDRKNSLINDMWEAFKKNKSHEEMMVQLNTIESQIARAEFNLANESKKTNPDEVYIEMQKEDIQIKSGALEALTNKMALDPNQFGQKIIRYKKNMQPIRSFRGDIAIRHKNSGDIIRYVKPGESYDLKNTEVAIENPVILKPVVEHEAIDGAAFAYSTLGYYSHVAESDLVKFRSISSNAKRKIKKSMSDIMKTYGYRDWQRHEADVTRIIDGALIEIKKLAQESGIADNPQTEFVPTFLGQLPKSRQTYGQDFLMSMLVPDFTGNPNEYHFSPKSGNFIQAVRAPKKSVINAVFKAMDQYQVHTNHADFVKEFAKTHRGFYDAIVGGQGYHTAMQRLANTSFEGALLKSTIEKSLNSPFMNRKDFKDMQQYFDAMPALDSEVAEYFRQIIQDGALTDPMTAFSLRRKIIEDPLLGEKAYKEIFQKSRGQVLFDGLSSKKYGFGEGEGQLVGDLMITKKEIFNRSLTSNISSRKGTKFSDSFDTVIGFENNKKGVCN